MFDVQAAMVPLAEGDEPLVLELIQPSYQQTSDQRDLLDARARYHALLSDIPEAVLVFDAQTLQVLDVNETAVHRYGFSRAEWLGLTILDIRPPSQLARTFEALRTATAERQTVYTHVLHRRKDGTAFPVDVYSRRHQFHGREVYVAVCVDITERLRQEEHRQVAEQIYRKIVTHSPLGILTGRVDPDGTLILELMNPAAEQWLGVRAENCLGRPAREIFPSLQSPGREELYRAVVRDQKPLEVDEVPQELLGRKSVFHVKAFPITSTQMVLVVEDITRRKAAEEALRASEERYRTLIESSPDAIFTLDENLEVTSVNAALARGLDVDPIYPPPGLLRQAATQLSGRPLALDEVHRLARECFETGEPRMVEPTITWQGRELTVNICISPAKDAWGKVRQVVGVVRDVTPLRRMERQLARTHRLEALGRLAGGIAHDFNNVLACIQGNLDLALMGDLNDPANRQGLVIARESCDRAAELVRAILTYTRQGRVHPESVNLNDVVAEVLRMLRSMLVQDIAISHEGQDDLWSVRVDPSRAIQVLMNLCLNARDAMPKGGKLIIGTSNLTLDAEACCARPQARPGQFVCLSVTDSGRGVPPEAIEHIFEPFFTTKPPSEGTGLGLSVVYGIVTQAGGWIEVTSQPGQGAEFRVHFPRDGGQ